MFSGRAYLWSQYIEAYLDGSIINILVGFGPEAWVGRFSLYAHNTFVSYLYELGLFGVAAFLWLLISNFITALHANSDDKPILISCHIGFFVLKFWPRCRSGRSGGRFSRTPAQPNVALEIDQSICGRNAGAAPPLAGEWLVAAGIRGRSHSHR